MVTFFIKVNFKTCWKYLISCITFWFSLSYVLTDRRLLKWMNRLSSIMFLLICFFVGFVCQNRLTGLVYDSDSYLTSEIFFLYRFITKFLKQRTLMNDFLRNQNNNCGEENEFFLLLNCYNPCVFVWLTDLDGKPSHLFIPIWFGFPAVLSTCWWQIYRSRHTIYFNTYQVYMGRGSVRRYKIVLYIYFSWITTLIHYALFQ